MAEDTVTTAPDQGYNRWNTTNIMIALIAGVTVLAMIATIVSQVAFLAVRVVNAG